MNLRWGLLVDMGVQSVPKIHIVIFNFSGKLNDFITKNKLNDDFHPGLVMNSKGNESRYGCAKCTKSFDWFFVFFIEFK